MADEAIQYMKQIKAVAPDKPFLVYYVPGGTHAPHHPTPEWIKKIGDMHLFDKGWNKLRETIFANQKRLGIMPANAQLTPWPKELPQWDSLDFLEKKLFIKQADVYGAYLAYTDHEIGRVVQAVEDLGQLSALRGRQGSGPQFDGELDPDHVSGGRDLRHRPGHAHRRRAAGVSLRRSVQAHRHDQQAHVQPRAGAGHCWGTRADEEDRRPGA